MHARSPKEDVRPLTNGQALGAHSYMQTFSRDTLSPRVNLLSEIYKYQHMLCSCRRRESQEDLGLFLNNMAC